MLEQGCGRKTVLPFPHPRSRPWSNSPEKSPVRRINPHDELPELRRIRGNHVDKVVLRIMNFDLSDKLRRLILGLENTKWHNARDPWLVWRPAPPLNVLASRRPLLIARFMRLKKVSGGQTPIRPIVRSRRNCKDCSNNWGRALREHGRVAASVVVLTTANPGRNVMKDIWRRRRGASQPDLIFGVFFAESRVIRSCAKRVRTTADPRRPAFRRLFSASSRRWRKRRWKTS